MTVLQPTLRHDFGNAIWRMEIDDLTDVMIIEVRNQKDKQVSFASVGLITNVIHFDNLLTDERWLAGIECAHDGIALLHYYKHESGPEHKSVIGINLNNGEQQWSNYSHAFDHLTINGPAVYNTNLQPKKILLADIKTGDVFRAYQETDKPLPNSIVIPALASANHLAGIPLAITAVGNIVHYVHHNNYRIVSLHALKNGLLQQQLFILNGDDVVYTDLLNTGIQKLQPEAFVLHKNVLIYIKNKTEIVVLPI